MTARRTTLVLGSTSGLKQAALLAACDRLGLDVIVETAVVTPVVPAQPVGLDETTAGARWRAMGAWRQHPLAYAVGVENGVRRRDVGYDDFAVVVAISPLGCETVVVSKSVPVPEDVVVEALRRGGVAKRDPHTPFLGSDVTFGYVLAEREGCAADDPHSFLTGGAQSRAAILADALERALRAVVPLALLGRP